jgi:hypothetical protein
MPAAAAPARTAAAGPQPRLATAAPSAAVRRGAAIPVGRPASILSGVVVTVGTPRPVKVTANAPGEIAGSGVGVVVTVQNTSGRPFSLDGVVVTAVFGSGVPADTSDVPPANPLRGSLAAGATKAGTYVFRVPPGSGTSLLLEVSSSQAPTILRFKK